MLYSIITIIQSYLLINQCNVNSPSIEGGVLSPGLVKNSHEPNSSAPQPSSILVSYIVITPEESLQVTINPHRKWHDF